MLPKSYFFGINQENSKVGGLVWYLMEFWIFFCLPELRLRVEIIDANWRSHKSFESCHQIFI